MGWLLENRWNSSHWRRIWFSLDYRWAAGNIPGQSRRRRHYRPSQWWRSSPGTERFPSPRQSEKQSGVMVGWGDLYICLTWNSSKVDMMKVMVDMMTTVKLTNAAIYVLNNKTKYNYIILRWVLTFHYNTYLALPVQVFLFQGIQSYSSRKIWFFLAWSCRNFPQSVSPSPSPSWSSPPRPPVHRPKQRGSEVRGGDHLLTSSAQLQ